MTQAERQPEKGRTGRTGDYEFRMEQMEEKKMRNDVQCPFFLHCDGRKRVTCEGVADGSRLQWVFRRKLDYDIRLKTFCCQHYGNCEVFRLAMEKYAD